MCLGFYKLDTFFLLQPTSDKDHQTRKDKEINIDNFKNFHARRRWKHSMKVVALCNKLSRSRQKLGGVDEPPMVEAPVVSNMTTGKTVEVCKHWLENYLFYFISFTSHIMIMKTEKKSDFIQYFKIENIRPPNVISADQIAWHTTPTVR